MIEIRVELACGCALGARVGAVISAGSPEAVFPLLGVMEALGSELTSDHDCAETARRVAVDEARYDSGFRDALDRAPQDTLGACALSWAARRVRAGVPIADTWDDLPASQRQAVEQHLRLIRHLALADGPPGLT